MLSLVASGDREDLTLDSKMWSGLTGLILQILLAYHGIPETGNPYSVTAHFLEGISWVVRVFKIIIIIYKVQVYY